MFLGVRRAFLLEEPLRTSAWEARIHSMKSRRWTHTRWMKFWGFVNNWIYAKTRWLLMENGNELFVAKTFCLTFPSAVLHGFSCVINHEKSLLKTDKENMQFESSELHRDTIKIIFLFFHISNSTRLLQSCDVIHRKAWTGLLNTVQIYSFKQFSFSLNLVQWLKVGANPRLQDNGGTSGKEISTNRRNSNSMQGCPENSSENFAPLPT